MREILGVGHYDFMARLQGEGVSFGGTAPVDEPVGREGLYGTTEEQFWKLIKFDAEHEQEREVYDYDLGVSRRDRRIREMKEAALNAPPLAEGKLSLDETLSRLEGVRRTGNGWRAQCPVHGSRGGTLAIAASTKHPGTPLLYCFAGCGYKELVAAIQTRS